MKALDFTHYYIFFLRFYAGGSEHSGQQIVEPPKKNNLNEIVDDLFKEAKEHGAVPVDHWAEGVGEANRAVVRECWYTLRGIVNSWVSKSIFALFLIILKNCHTPFLKSRRNF